MLSHFLRQFALAAAVAIFLSVPRFAQEQDDTSGAGAEAPPVETQDSDAAGPDDPAEPEGEESVPETFDPLFEEFQSLIAEVRAEGGEPAAKTDKLQDLHARVKAFNDARTPSELSVAVEYQLLEWTNQFGEDRNDLIARLQAMDLQHPGLQIKLANELIKRKSRPEEGLEVLDEADIDPAEYPVAAILRAEALNSASRYDEAAAAIEAIPADVNLTPELLDRRYGVGRQIDMEAEAWSLERELRAAEAAADDLPRVEITTDKGAFTIELFENTAPNTVANFIALVESGFYDGMKFHGVNPNLMVSTGNPQTKEAGVALIEGDGPGYKIADETPEEGARTNWTGSVSMIAGRGPEAGTAGSQFRITLRRVPHFDGAGVVFGRVIDGMRVVRNIQREDGLLTARVLRKRDHAYEPVIIEEDEEVETPDGAADGDDAAADDGEGEGDAGEEGAGESGEDDAAGDDNAADDAREAAGDDG